MKKETNKESVNERVEIRLLRGDKNGKPVEKNYETIINEVKASTQDEIRLMSCKIPEKRFKDILIWQEYFYEGNKADNYELIYTNQLIYYFFRARKINPKNNTYKEVIYELYPRLFFKSSKEFEDSIYKILKSDKFWNNYGEKFFTSDLDDLRSFENDKIIKGKRENVTLNLEKIKDKNSK